MPEEFAVIFGECLSAWSYENAQKIGSRNITILAEGTTDFGMELMEAFDFAPCQDNTPENMAPHFHKETTLKDIRDFLGRHPGLAVSRVLDKIMKFRHQ